MDITKLTPTDAGWPTALNTIPDAPEALWVKGNLDALNAPGLAIVGSRAASSYGSMVATDFASYASQLDATVISGGAFGIDEAAHRGALARKGTTIVVLPSGLDKPTPHAHVRLFDEVAGNGGLLISEYEPGTAPTRARFLRRNLIIAALADRGVILVEGAIRSGSLNTMRHAETLGRRRFAVPGPLTSVTSKGPNRLIADGRAQAIAATEDLEQII